jgi:anti-sigma factor RsiW
VTCSRSEALFEGYLDDTLSPAQRAALIAHLDGCGHCKGVLEELRVVDALIGSPRHVELPENFTFATIAEIRSLPRPHVSSAPVLAYLVSYLVASWLLVGAGFLLASSTVRAFGETIIDLAFQMGRPLGAIGHAGARILGDFGAFGTVIGTALALDVVLGVALVFGFTVLRPHLLERLRS